MNLFYIVFSSFYLTFHQVASTQSYSIDFYLLRSCVCTSLSIYADISCSRMSQTVAATMQTVKQSPIYLNNLLTDISTQQTQKSGMTVLSADNMIYPALSSNSVSKHDKSKSPYQVLQAFSLAYCLALSHFLFSPQHGSIANWQSGRVLRIVYMAMHLAHPITRSLEGFTECVPEIS